MSAATADKARFVPWIEQFVTFRWVDWRTSAHIIRAKGIYLPLCVANVSPCPNRLQVVPAHQRRGSNNAARLSAIAQRALNLVGPGM